MQRPRLIKRVTPVKPEIIVDREEWPPDYPSILEWRIQNRQALQKNPNLLFGAKQYYKTRPVDWVLDWCITYDPRNAGTDLPTTMPFVLFERQADLIQFFHDCVKQQEAGLCVKSREMGATWCAVAFSDWMWRFWDGAAIRWGSRERDLVDKIGDPDSIFEKIRMNMRAIPPEFNPKGFSWDTHVNFMRIINPETQASISGDIGDNIGRGGRASCFLVDEAAHLEHPEMVEAALSETTRCPIYISSVNAWAGGGHVFQAKHEAGVTWERDQPLPKGKTRIFELDWRTHPEKDQSWYDLKRQRAEAEGLLHVFAQEIDRDYSAAVVGVIIPSAHVQAAVDAHLKLGFTDDGGWHGALDVADEGNDRNALTLRKGIVLKYVKEWGERDVGVTTRNVVGFVERYAPIDIDYDCVGLGAAVKAEINRLREDKLLKSDITFIPWNAGAETLNPDKSIDPRDKKSPTNSDFFTNLKAQAWWQLARRFEKTWRAINDPDFRDWEVDDLISLSSKDIGPALLPKVIKELSQPTMGKSSRLKLLINKKPDGAPSPNIGDSLVMNYWPLPAKRPIKIPNKAMVWAKFRSRGVPISRHL